VSLPLCLSHLVEGLAVVHADDGANHLRHNNHVTEVRPDDLWLLPRGCVLLSLAQLLDERQRLSAVV
jgi:hypothetical protein